MKHFISVLAAVAVAQAATPVGRQASPSAAVRAAVQAIIDDAGALQSAVESFTSSAQLGAVGAAISKLQGDVDGGASQFQGLQPVSNDDAIQLSNLVDPLTGATDSAVNAVINKKQVIVDQCAGKIAYDSFNQLIPSAQTFADNLSALIPESFRPVITQASGKIQASLQRGLQAFQDAQTLPDSCTGGGGTTTPPSDGTTTPPSGSSSTGLPGTYPTGSTTPAPSGSSTTVSLPGGYTPSSTSKSPVATYVGGAAQGAMANLGVVALAVVAAAL